MADSSSSRSSVGSRGIPEGFAPVPFGKGFVDMVGPLYVKREGRNATLGLWVEDRHTNPAGICHGGMLMTVADMQIGVGVQAHTELGKFIPTVNMTVDFISAAREGDWIQGSTDVHRVTRNFAFASCLLESAAGETILRANGIVKIPSGDGLPRKTRVKD
ncbi:MAG: PaaI family thioesterase [Minwuiales bacterium]|nr:PaaI family thioesterase [Minwuiales bacterium]